MTYFGFLFLFVGVPIVLLAAITIIDIRGKRELPSELRTWSPVYVVAAHVVVALVYTTPWDNYLVATRVWWYDPNLVTGIVLGWVPIEEYSFFVLQTVLTGLWTLILARRWQPSSRQQGPMRVQYSVPTEVSAGAGKTATTLRVSATLFVGVLWLISLAILASGWDPGTYLGLELIWALPPIGLQLAFGADILWRYRRIVATSILPVTLYLCWADSLAIQSGTWTINPLQSTGIMIGNLPVEEAVFFLITNMLVVFGVVLVLAEASQQRAPTSLVRTLRRFVPQHPRGSLSNA